ncbi:hypothetical protein GCM10011487_02680 [Steroidobacter agaridevorans]|uniref:Uncharacterized protein n=1 Tax=Steroidobacter agaridevorans TaxID=2695856 RepID=A0A829Y5P7_9GAMM|nr:hypothetical protein [Steroidobacter agaridevorans]GFE78268.1 hypothetical protein GCM10011487_02680 [Steroidobacter agaridevorans]GFE89799.1 hypothetical protein GCM10011488_47530 [Steroidobacter agaridevorans]
MIKPVKGSDLEEQIELARQRIERWPQWLKDAAGMGGKDDVESSSSEKLPDGRIRLSPGDFID